jgi:transcriptional regulator with XRE-family HTH domain
MAGRLKKTPESSRFYRDLGRVIHLARIAAGKTQIEMAEDIGVSFQQLQKYENGKNRIPVEQLVAMAACLEIPVARLLSLRDRETELAPLTENLHAKSFHALLESWAEIEDQGMRAAILNVVKRAAALSR